MEMNARCLGNEIMSKMAGRLLLSLIDLLGLFKAARGLCISCGDLADENLELLPIAVSKHGGSVLLPVWWRYCF